MILQKINIIGNKYVHKYAKKNVDGSISPNLLEVECTKVEYESLSTSTAPQLNGYQWVASVERHKFDSSSGDLENGMYAQVVNNVIKVPGMNPVSFDAAVNINFGLTDADQTKIDPKQSSETWVVKEKMKIGDVIPVSVDIKV